MPCRKTAPTIAAHTVLRLTIAFAKPALGASRMEFWIQIDQIMRKAASPAVIHHGTVVNIDFSPPGLRASWTNETTPQKKSCVWVKTCAQRTACVQSGKGEAAGPSKHHGAQGEAAHIRGAAVFVDENGTASLCDGDAG